MCVPYSKVLPLILKPKADCLINGWKMHGIYCLLFCFVCLTKSMLIRVHKVMTTFLLQPIMLHAYFSE